MKDHIHLLFAIFSKFQRIWVLLVALMVILASCDTWDYSPYEVDDDGPTNINANNIAQFIDNVSDTTIIAIIGDTQRFYDASEGIIHNINALEHVDFVAHTGDIVDFGLQREYNWTVELLNQLNVPYVAVVGNHDLIGNGENIYKKMFGPLNFSFVFNNTKYIYINTCGREFGFEPDVPDINWLQQELSDNADFSQSIIIQHVPPGNGDFNLDLVADYLETMNNNGNVILSINGHNHNFAFSEASSGIGFLNSFSGGKRNYVLLKVWEGGYEFEIME